MVEPLSNSKLENSHAIGQLRDSLSTTCSYYLSSLYSFFKSGTSRETGKQRDDLCALLLIIKGHKLETMEDGSASTTVFVKLDSFLNAMLARDECRSTLCDRRGSLWT